MIRCTRRLEFDAGHRVTLHESKCRNVHGHRYRVEITCEAPELDDAGRVVDFGAVKGHMGPWLDDHLDHGYLFREGDPVGQWLGEQGHKVYQMPVDLGEPTAENIARLVGRVARQKLNGDGLRVVHVRVYETPNCWADWEPSDA